MFEKVLVILVCLIWSHYTLSIGKLNGHGHQIAESQSVLDPNGEILLKWRVDYTNKHIRFTLVFSGDAQSFSWLAVGFSDRGELNTTDVCLLWTDYKGREHFQDMHGFDGRLLVDRQQDCKGYWTNWHDDKYKMISFERRFDTCDDDDYIIEDGTTHVIWSRGKDKLFTSRGLCVWCTDARDRGFARLRLLTTPALPPPKGKQLRFAASKVKVPGKDTTYWCKVTKLPSFMTSKMHHIVQFESSITKGNEGLVHHMELFYCDSGPDEDIPLYEGDCFGANRPESTKTCSKVKAAWAMGAPPFTYPQEAGLPIGGPKANKYVMLEVHYNNPEMKNDWVDSSGISLHVTPTLRKYSAAIMELGLEYTDKMAIPAGSNAFALTGYCVPQCTGVGLPSEGIVVFGSQLHTHLTGVAVWTRHARDGVELKNLNRDMHYSTHFQEIRLLHEPVRVLPGDYLETTCIYRTLDRDSATVGGHSITDEMCVNYIHYYPATQLEVCKSAVSNRALEKYFQFEKYEDNMLISFTSPPRANYLAISPWTPLREEALQKLYTEAPISMQCNKSDGNRFQGYWEGLQIPDIEEPLPPTMRDCPVDQQNSDYYYL